MGASVAAGTGGVLRGIIDDFCFYNEGFTDKMATALYAGNALYIQQHVNTPTSLAITSFTVTPDRIAYNGEVEVKWESVGALGCLLLGTADSAFPTSGTKKYLNLTKDKLFIVSCWDSQGSVKKQVTVQVGASGKGIPVIKEDIRPLQEYIQLPVPPESQPAVSTLEPEPAPPAQIPSLSLAPTVTQLPPPTKGTPNLDLPVGCSEYIHTYMKKSQKNDVADVRRLQIFLNETIYAQLPVSGFFGALTHKAVQRFQVKYNNEIIKPWLDAGYVASDITNGTGYVYKTTKYQINLMKCATLNVPKPILLDDLR